MVIEDITSKDGKTAELAKLLKKVGAERNSLVVVEQKTPELMRASRNLPGVQVISAKYVTVYDVLNADHVMFTAPALKVTTDWLTAKPAKRPSREAK